WTLPRDSGSSWKHEAAHVSSAATLPRRNHPEPTDLESNIESPLEPAARRAATRLATDITKHNSAHRVNPPARGRCRAQAPIESHSHAYDCIPHDLSRRALHATIIHELQLPGEETARLDSASDPHGRDEAPASADAHAPERAREQIVANHGARMGAVLR